MIGERPGFDDTLADLGGFLLALREYLEELVLCGGWVPFFYRHLALGAEPRRNLLLTFDFDLVAPTKLPVHAAGSIDDCLRAGGFLPFRNREPPVVRYQHERWGEENLAHVTREFLLSTFLRDRPGTR